MIAVFGVFVGKYKHAIAGMVCYAVILVGSQYILQSLSGVWQAMFAAFLGLAYKVYPCGMMLGVMIGSTKISEFMVSLYRLHIPKSIGIPFAVMMRYVPVIFEDWQYIKDVMKMRGISPSIKGLITNPSMTVECVKVPFMMAASITADGLSIASVARGIENPNPRSSLTEIGFCIQDGITVFIFFLCFLATLVARGG
ncbi:MAG: energy-coupling factor transporter transmembrane protein EcfT [Clostridia bacterium]|nr:energy-coupling factor transporter transmembrane protein EcfT [Clostridia bacterium]